MIDRDQLVQDRLCDLIRSRPSGTTAAADRSRLRLGVGRGDSQHPAQRVRGELGYLAAISPAVHRLALETTDRHAAAIAAAIADTAEVAPEIARLQGMALAGVFQVIISEAGNRTRRDRARPRSPTSCTRSSGERSMSSTAGFRPPSHRRGPRQTAAVDAALKLRGRSASSERRSPRRQR